MSSDPGWSLDDFVRNALRRIPRHKNLYEETVDNESSGRTCKQDDTTNVFFGDRDRKVNLTLYSN